MNSPTLKRKRSLSPQSSDVLRRGHRTPPGHRIQPPSLIYMGTISTMQASDVPSPQPLSAAHTIRPSLITTQEAMMRPVRLAPSPEHVLLARPGPRSGED